MKRTINTTNAELNKAIWTVLTTQFKKEAPEAFEMVKAAGYEYYKSNGNFTVHNPRTKRTIYLYDKGRATYIYHGCYKDQQSRINDWNNCKFDFVGCLEKPTNDEWHDSQRWEPTSKALDQYHGIAQKKRMVKSYEQDVENIKTQIAALQDKLIRYTTYKVECEQSLTAYRKELGLA